MVRCAKKRDDGNRQGRGSNGGAVTMVDTGSSANFAGRQV
jgi:hypothetical protein